MKFGGPFAVSSETSLINTISINTSFFWLDISCRFGKIVDRDRFFWQWDMKFGGPFAVSSAKPLLPLPRLSVSLGYVGMLLFIQALELRMPVLFSQMGDLGHLEPSPPP